MDLWNIVHIKYLRYKNIIEIFCINYFRLTRLISVNYLYLVSIYLTVLLFQYVSNMDII